VPVVIIAIRAACTSCSITWHCAILTACSNSDALARSPQIIRARFRILPVVSETARGRAANPCRQALLLEIDFPPVVRGPVLLAAFVLLAASFRVEILRYLASSCVIVSFRRSEPLSRFKLLLCSSSALCVVRRLRLMLAVFLRQQLSGRPSLEDLIGRVPQAFA
jgi:hypothetical protein